MQDALMTFIHGSGFGQVTYGNLVMIAVGFLFIYLAIKKGFEPLLLVPIGFGILIGNVPYDRSQLSLSVYDGPVSETKLDFYTIEPVVYNGESYGEHERLKPERFVRQWANRESGEGRIKRSHLSEAMDLVRQGKVIMVHREEMFVYLHRDDNGEFAEPEPGVYWLGHGGHSVYVPDPDQLTEEEREERGGNRYNIVVEPEYQDTWNASVMWMLFRGIEWGFFPPLIFLGVGAMTDFGPLLAQPRLILLGAAAQLGIFGALLAALLLHFDIKEAASIGIIGGADGPTAIFTCSQLAPHLLGAVALSAYSYMAMVPIIQPPIMRALTTKEERLRRMPATKSAPRTVRIIFPIAGFLLTAFIANGGLALLGMLFFGNLLRECLVTERLQKTATTSLIDIVTILLGLTVGAKTQAANFLTLQTIQIFVLGILAFSIATATGVLFAKLMNLFSKDKINPLVGAAGVSAVPMAARVVQKVAHSEDPHNFLLMHAMGPNVAGVIGSAVAAGVLLSYAG